MFENKKILITGGTGSWGHELTRQLLVKNPKEIRIFSRNEAKQVEMLRYFGGDARLNFHIGDVRDLSSLMSASHEIDYIFHLAALKHLPICEKQPDEALKTNVQGTKNVIDAAIAHGVKKVIDVSTDKAVDPFSFYGMTKAIGEKLIIHANSYSNSTKFICVRGGNVLGTNGSVVPFFKKQILEEQSLYLTDKNMTRFFLTVQEAISLLFIATEVGKGGETFVMHMPACRIVDLANVMIKRLANHPIEMKIVGIRPGEKLHELLISKFESQTTRRFSDAYYVILPSSPTEEMKLAYADCEPVTFESYQSNDVLMGQEDIEIMLKKGGLL